MVTEADKRYNIGDRLVLLEPTGQAPHGAISNLCNWKVKCRYFEPPVPQSIWSNIWVMIEYGHIGWEGEGCEHTCDGTNVCTKCGWYNAGKGGYVCDSYNENDRCRDPGPYKGPTCRNCDFNFVLHNWQERKIASG
jgi:hypothetical protein